jgi:hypothetical protein
MSDVLVKTTDFSGMLESAVEDFRKALLKRWRERVATAVAEGKYDFPAGWRRSKASRGEPMWPFWEPLYRLHLDYAHMRCRVIHWAENGQKGAVPQCEGSMDRGGGLSSERPSYVNGKGQLVPIPDSIQCGMRRLMEQVEGWSYEEAGAVRTAMPQFDAHDLDAIEQAQAALLKLGGLLGLSAGAKSDQALPFTPTSNAALTEDLKALVGTKGEDPGWYAAWTGVAADALKDGFFASVTPTVSHQAGIAAGLANLYASRGTVVQQGRAGDLDILKKATAALDATQTGSVKLDVVWKVFAGVGTTVSAFPPAALAGTAISLAGIAGEIFLPEAKTVSYAKTVEEVMASLWTYVDDHKAGIEDVEADYAAGAAALRDLVYGVHSYNLELYDLTQNDEKGNGGEGFTAQTDEILEVADTCFEAARAYEEQLIPLLNDLDKADGSLRDQDGAEAAGDARLKGLLEEFRGFLSTACGRFYEAGTQIKAAAERYKETDDQQRAAFDSVAWDEADAPEQAREWAKATDRSGWNPYEGSNVKQAPPGHADPGADDYATALGG